MGKKKKLTRKAIKAYVKSDGGHCPYCESKNVTGGHIEACDAGAQQETECDDCGRKWLDCHKLVDVLELD